MDCEGPFITACSFNFLTVFSFVQKPEYKSVSLQGFCDGFHGQLKTTLV